MAITHFLNRNKEVVDRDDASSTSTRVEQPFNSPLTEVLSAEANLPPVYLSANIAPNSEKSDVPGPPPNGGFHAWLQVAGAFFMFFNSWGTVNTFGVFQTYYETGLLANKSASEISWIGSIQAALLMIIGVIAGPAYDAGYFRYLIISGTILIPFGFMMTSISTEYWHVILAQGVCIGVGNGLIFVPSVALLPQYFSTRKSLANGIAAAGSSLGGVIYPIVFRQLYPRIGFGWATRVIGFLSLATCLFSVAVMRVRIMPKQKRSLLELKAFKEPPYAIFCFAMFLGFLAFYGPVYYLGPYAINNHITNVDLGFYLLAMLNAASVFGRVLPNFISDYTGPLNMLIPATFCTAIIILSWIGISNAPGIIVFSILYGFFSGGYVSLPQVALVNLTPDMRTLGTRMGQCFFIAAMGLLIGSPLAGIIVTDSGSYLGLQLFSGLLMLVTGVLLVTVRVLKAGKSIRAKV